MRILIAGATGAIGRPLVRCLKEHRHTVFALTRSPQSARAVGELGAEPAGRNHQRVDFASAALHGRGNEGCCGT